MPLKIPEIRYAQLPKQWPGKPRPVGWTPARKSPFKVTTWSAVERALGLELARIEARDVVIAIDLPNPASWNMQDKPRADAKPRSSRAIVSFKRRDGAQFVFPADGFTDWITNVYAIALTLERLRAIDRYGVTQGNQQYAGFLALPAPRPGNEPTPEEAAHLIAQHSDFEEEAILKFPSVQAKAIQTAKARTHPDTTKASPAEFQAVVTAERVLLREGETVAG